MTVIKFKERSYSHTRSNSDTESLHIPSSASSDVESSTDEPISVTQNKYLRCKLPTFQCGTIKLGKFGKRKQRRYYNRLCLETVEEEEDDVMTAFTVMPFYKGPFTRLLENEEALQAWNEFIDKSEEEQLAVLNKPTADLNRCENCQQKKYPLDSYWKISSKIRRTLRIKKNISLELVSGLENPIINCFKSERNATYSISPPTSFQRLLVHGIAQYHSLNSISFFINGKSHVEVTNLNPEWESTPVLFSSFIENLRSH